MIEQSQREMPYLPAGYTRLRWLFVLVVALHNFEEWLTFPHMGETAVIAARRLGFVLQTPPWSALQVGLAVATLVPAAAVVFAAAGRPSRRKEMVVAFFVSIFFVNVFLPHVAAAVLIRGYAPGLATALFVNLPFALFYYRAALAAGVLTRRSLTVTIALAAVALASLGTLGVSAGLR